MKNLFPLLLFSLLFSCQKTTSKDVLPKEEMVSVLGDFYLATEMVAMQRLPRDSSSLYLKSVYKPMILKKHNITSEKFDLSYRFYTARPEEFYVIQKAVADSMKIKHLRGRVNF